MGSETAAMGEAAVILKEMTNFEIFSAAASANENINAFSSEIVFAALWFPENRR